MTNVTLSSNGERPIVTLGKVEREPESPWRAALRRYRKHHMAVIGTLLLAFVLLFVLVGPLFYSEDYGNKTSILNKYQPPSAEHPFGTDQVGRDVLTRVIYGGQISIAIAVVSVLISIFAGTVVGLTAGYFGGWVDSLLMRIVEAMLAIPALFLLLMLSNALSRTTATVNILGRELSVTVVVIVLIIGLTSWMTLSRIVRALVMSLKQQEFIMAAQSIGARDGRIIRAHILPNVLAPVIVSATLGVGAAIITESYLSFLGFGVLPPTATWGNILTRAQDHLDSVWWLWVAPGFFIVITVLAINFIGDGLRDALDPRSTK
jgi:peptide/nickel transport system permease protein